jgi:hypothetical protein
MPVWANIGAAALSFAPAAAVLPNLAADFAQFADPVQIADPVFDHSKGTIIIAAAPHALTLTIRATADSYCVAAMVARRCYNFLFWVGGTI